MNPPSEFTHFFYFKITTVFDTKHDPNMDLAWNHTENVRSAITNPGNLFCMILREKLPLFMQLLVASFLVHKKLIIF